MPADLVDFVRRSSEIGRSLYLLDQVAATGTDVLLSRVPDPDRAGVRGYIQARDVVDGRVTDSYVVSFYTADDPPRIAYEVELPPGSAPRFFELAPPKEAPPSFATIVRAREAALAAVPGSAQPLNPVVLAASENPADGVAVYLLAGTTRPNLAVLGQHFRVVVPAGGGSPPSVTPLSKGTLELPTVDPDGHRAEALMMSHVVTDYPLETHVFASLLHRLRLYVATRRGIFRVDGDRISLVALPPEKDR